MIYDDALPVDEEWVAEHAGQEVTFHVPCDIYTLVLLDGMDGMGNWLDETLGVVLGNWTMRLAEFDNDGEPPITEVLLAVTGEVAEF